MYMDMVMILKRFIHAEHAGLWEEHLAEVEKMLPYKTRCYFTGISQQPAAMEKYLRALPVLTAVSEQTKAMAHLDMDDTKHHEDSNSQGTKEAESVRKITDVINRS
ncbi:hypothetical protein AAFF_G00318650 [Aldrovandia affinis]|uniref:Uncharacterized protein n=1 Tax=Aldrovandia affinis TaxID=143900 RepID=A0AAD7SMG2_9TELE|nr:hypothetical protein AAFF_G00318650 [Aldrovandia affinis]